MSGHTPGPWLADDLFMHAGRKVRVGTADGICTICECWADSIRNSQRQCPHIVQAEANARLIAAAPDLLALARLYASECGDCNGTGVAETWVNNDANDITKGVHKEDIDCPDCADIRAVIAKAEGRS